MIIYSTHRAFIYTYVYTMPLSLCNFIIDLRMRIFLMFIILLEGWILNIYLVLFCLWKNVKY